MNTEKLSELMHRELDGTISPKGKEELGHELEKNEEARQVMNKLRQVHAKLSKIEEIEPPADLKESVMRSLPAARYKPQAISPSVFEKIVRFVEIPRVQMAGMFSFGMAAALLLFVVAENYNGKNAPSGENVVGTLTSLNKIDNTEPIDSRLVYTDGCTAEVKTSRHDEIIVAEISLELPVSRTVQLFVTSEKPGELRFSAVEQSVPRLAFANFGFDYFSATVAGNGTITLVFEDQGKDAGPIQVELKTENSSVIEAVAIERVNI